MHIPDADLIPESKATVQLIPDISMIDFPVCDGEGVEAEKANIVFPPKGATASQRQRLWSATHTGVNAPSECKSSLFENFVGKWGSMAIFREVDLATLLNPSAKIVFSTKAVRRFVVDDADSVEIPYELPGKETVNVEKDEAVGGESAAEEEARVSRQAQLV